MSLTSNTQVIKFTEEMKALASPRTVVWIDGGEEQLEALRAEACLSGELIRLNDIFNSANAESLIFLNEIFASTTNHDAYEMGMFMIDRISEINCMCIFATHVWTLATYGKGTVSLVAQTLETNGSVVSTYKVGRKDANNLAFGVSLAEKYKLTYREIKERINP